MDKEQAIHALWSSFGLEAYDENTVPDNAQFPYITYSVMTGDLGDVATLNASLWYRSTSWAEITQKSEEIAEYIGEYGHRVFKLDNGFMWVVKGFPFAQRMPDPEDSMIRRIYLNVSAEFLTGY